MQHSDPALTIEQGDLLIAPPRMRDTRFRDCVILITHHSTHGSYGLCLNKITHSTVQDLAVNIDCAATRSLPLYWGGPQHASTVWMLHTPEWSMANTVSINEDWSMTSNIEMFHCMAQGVVPNEFRIFCGFATWAADQLSNEIRGQEPWSHDVSWLTWHGPHGQELLDVDSDQLWSVSMNQCAQQAVDHWL